MYGPLLPLCRNPATMSYECVKIYFLGPTNLPSKRLNAAKAK